MKSALGFIVGVVILAALWYVGWQLFESSLNQQPTHSNHQ